MREPLIRPLLLLLLVGTALAGCGGAPRPEDTSRADLRIVVVTHGQSADPFWSVVANGVRDAAADLGVDVSYQAPTTFDMVAMANMIDAAVASRPAGLVVSIPDPTALGPSIRRAVEAGIPVVSINSGADARASLGVLAHVGQTEYEAGFAGGERLAAAGARRVLCVNHEVGNLAQDERCRGLDDALRQAGGRTTVLTVLLAGVVLTSFSGAVITFLLVLGPLDYLFVHHWVRRPWVAWVSFPLVVLAFGLAAMALADWRQSGGPRVNRLRLASARRENDREHTELVGGGKRLVIGGLLLATVFVFAFLAGLILLIIGAIMSRVFTAHLQSTPISDQELRAYALDGGPHGPGQRVLQEGRLPLGPRHLQRCPRKIPWQQRSTELGERSPQAPEVA